MKLALLTTESPHHVFFASELLRAFGDLVIFSESRQSTSPAFETSHPYEAVRDTSEWERWFRGDRIKLGDITRVFYFDSINTDDALQELKGAKADVVIVFGTGLIKDAVIDACSPNLFNLHGGDPERYRGLDSHLWAIYHRDFSSLITTLHRVSPVLDDGEIILQGQVPLREGLPLHELRAVNTELAVKLGVGAVDMVARYGDVISRPQKAIGRYYSSMPRELKTVCEYYFARYVGEGFSNGK